MTLIINGETKSVPLKTLQELLSHYKISPDQVIIEHNKTLYKTPFPKINFQENDTIEIIQFMGGG